MGSCKVAVMLSVTAMICLVTPAKAELNCDDLAGPNTVAGEVSTCLTPRLDRQSLLNVAAAIRQIVGWRLGADSNEVEVSAAVDSHVIWPAADVVSSPATSTPWNIWIDGKHSAIDGHDPISGADGRTDNVLGGLDYRFSDKVMAGVFVSYEDSRLETGEGALEAITRTSAPGAGAYVGLTLSETLVLSGTVGYSRIDTDIDVSASDVELDSDRLQASLSLTGYYYSRDFRASPYLQAAWTSDWQDDVPLPGGGFDQRTDTGILSAGSQFGYTIRIGEVTSIEPYIGAQVDWIFEDEVHTEGAGSEEVSDEDWDIHLLGGLNFSLAANVQLSLSADVSGLLLRESDTVTGGATLAVQF
jgi:outer membrane autotransporter protein